MNENCTIGESDATPRDASTAAGGVDAAIERVVRDAMSIDTEAALTARVIARITRYHAPKVWPRVLAAGCAMLILVAVISRVPESQRGDPTLVAPHAPTVPDGGAPPAAPRRPPDSQIVERGSRGISSPVPRSAAPRVTISPESRTGRAMGLLSAIEVPPLAGIDPVAIPPLETGELLINEIVVPPLPPMPALHVEPLGLGD